MSPLQAHASGAEVQGPKSPNPQAHAHADPLDLARGSCYAEGDTKTHNAGRPESAQAPHVCTRRRARARIRRRNRAVIRELSAFTSSGGKQTAARRHKRTHAGAVGDKQGSKFHSGPKGCDGLHCITQPRRGGGGGGGGGLGFQTQTSWGALFGTPMNGGLYCARGSPMVVGAQHNPPCHCGACPKVLRIPPDASVLTVQRGGGFCAGTLSFFSLASKLSPRNCFAQFGALPALCASSVAAVARYWRCDEIVPARNPRPKEFFHMAINAI